MSISYILIWITIGLIFGIIEIFAPVKHRFICVTLGADITAICNFLVADDIVFLAVLFVTVSAISIIVVTIHHTIVRRKENKEVCEQESP